MRKQNKENLESQKCSSQHLSVCYVFGRIIGQCKNCFHFGVVKDAKTIKYPPKGKGICHSMNDDNWATTHCNKNPDFGCWNWEPRKSKKKIVVHIKT